MRIMLRGHSVRSWIIEIVFVMKNHRIEEVVWVAHNVALDLAIVFVGFLMQMIDAIDRLIVMFLHTSAFLNDDGFLTLLNAVFIEFVLDLS